MKKVLSILLCVTMLISVSVTAFAAENKDTNNGTADTTITVTGTYVAGTTVTPTISADIVWEKMEFTYTDGDSSYDVTTHKTTKTDGSWNTDKKEISVTNHSNVSIIAGFSFTAGNGVTTTGSFYETKDSTTALGTDKQSFVLESAEGTSIAGGLSPVPSGKIYFGVSGDAISESKDLGTITVKITKELQTVSTEEDLRTALANGGKIRLENDITISQNENLTVSKNVELDLNEKKITGDLYGFQVNEGGNLTLENGSLKFPNSQCINVDKGTVSVENCTLESAGSIVSQSDGTSTVKNCVFNGTVLVENGDITLTKTTLNVYPGSSDKGIIIGDTGIGRVICDFDPTSYIYYNGKVTKNTDNTYTVTALKSTVGTTSETVSVVKNQTGLLYALGEGGKVKLGDSVTVQNDPNDYFIYIKNSTTVELDLNGKKLELYRILAVQNGATLTVNDSVGGGIVRFSSPEPMIEPSLNCYGTLVVNAGKWLADGTFEIGIYGETADVTVTGGTFNRGISMSYGKLTVTGGEIDYLDTGSYSVVTITGGTFGNDPTEYVDTDNYTVTEESGKYTVKKNS